MNRQKGITLIALMITIIVLLILAGISIATLTGENGSLNKSNKAKTENEIVTAKEKVQLAVMSSFDNSGKIDCAQLRINLDNVEGIDKSSVLNPIVKLPITVKVDNYNVTINEKGNVIAEKKGEEITNPPVRETATPGEIVTGASKEYTKNGTAVIPEGFAIVPGCDDVSQGLVISDDAGDTEVNSNNIIANGNQFVWVPVTNMTNFKLIEGYRDGVLENKIFDNLEPYINGYSTETEEYNAMCDSVRNNQGFYIGRYEAGKDSGGNLIVKKNSSLYNNIKWGSSMSNKAGGAVEVSQNFTKGKVYQGKVTSMLVYGIQWDAAMQFFDSNYVTGTCDENSYVRDSTGKGKYGLNSLINTGSNENYKVKNIYDMAGNAWEWTMEAFDSEHRVGRGGACYDTGSQNPVSARGTFWVPADANRNIGFRVALIV